MKTSKPLLTLRMLFPAAASFIVLLLGEWIARGSLTADTFISFIFPHFGAYLLAWLLLFLVWELLDWVLRIPPLATLGMAVLGCAPCAVNFYTMQLRGEPFLPWDLMQVSEAAGVASAVSGVSAAAALSLCAGTVLSAAEVAPQPASSRAASVRIRSCFFICLSSYTFFVFCDMETAIARFHPKTARRQNLRAEVANQPFSVSIAALVCATYRA